MSIKKTVPIKTHCSSKILLSKTTINRSNYLTESGERSIDDVISHVFQFINLLKTSGPLQWFYEELKYLAEQQFEQQDAERPQNYASNLSVSSETDRWR